MEKLKVFCSFDIVISKFSSINENMKQGKHRIKKEIGGYGFFGEVELEVEQSEVTIIEFGTNIDQISNSREYKNSIEYGIYYSINRINNLKKNPMHFFVRVLKIATFPVDSSPTVLSFVSARAFFDAINFDSEYPKFGEQNGEIIFTK